MANPPSVVKIALESICILLGEKADTWKGIRSAVMKDNFISTIVNFETENITLVFCLFIKEECRCVLWWYFLAYGIYTATFMMKLMNMLTIMCIIQVFYKIPSHCIECFFLAMYIIVNIFIIHIS